MNKKIIPIFEFITTDNTQTAIECFLWADLY